MNWLEVSRNPNYLVNELGEVKNATTGKILSQYVNKGNGYLYVSLWKDNKQKKVPVHRLVAEAFIPNPKEKPCIDHADGNRQNNAIENLRWCTYSENNSRFGTRGVRSERILVTHYRETRNPRGGGHVSWGGSDKVIEFDRICDAAEHFGCTDGNISQMLKKGNIGRRGKTRGYRFTYARKNV